MKDKDLLLGLVAARLGLAPRETLTAYAETFVRSSGEADALASELERTGAIEPSHRPMLEDIVEDTIRAHGGDARRALETFGGERGVQDVFGQRFAISVPALTPAGARPSIDGVLQDEQPERTTREQPGRYRFEPAAPRAPSAPPGASTTDLVGKVIGRGGMGQIRVAHDEHLGREVAVKELSSPRPSLIPGGPPSPSSESQPVLARFLREARVTAQLEHPNIVPVYELGRRADGQLYYTMKLVRGRTLAAALRDASDLDERLRLLGHFVGLCQAIAYAHSRGVVHRDIKPLNVMVGEFGETVVIDWGVAKVRGKRDIRGKDLEREIRILRDSEGVHTVPGSAFGTPAYMAPEQARGEIDQVDERSDVWSLGIVLYEILAGRVPFIGPSPLAVLMKVIDDPPPPLLEVNPDVPPELAAVVDRAVRRDRTERYQSARELAEEVETFRNGGRVEAHTYSTLELARKFAETHRGAVAVAAVAVACLAVVGAGAWLKVLGERDRALRAEAESRRSMAEVLTERARASAQALDWSAAELHGATALATAELPAARGVLMAAAGGWRPRLLFEVSPFSPCAALAIGGGGGGGSTIVCAAGTEVPSWDAHSGAEQGVLRLEGGWAQRLAASSSAALAIGRDDGAIEVWSAGRRTAVMGEARRGARRAEPSAPPLAFSADGRRVAWRRDARRIEVRDVGTSRVVELATAGHDVLALAFSPDGALLAAGAGDGRVRLFDLAASAGRLRAVLAGHTGGAAALAFSPDGLMIAAAGRDRAVTLWDTSGALRGHLLGHDGAVRALVFTPDSSGLITAGADRSVRLWDAARLEMVGRLPAFDAGITAIALSPDGEVLAVSTEDRKLRAFSAASPNGPKRVLDLGASARSLSAGGTVLAAGAADGVVRLVDLDLGEVVAVLGAPKAQPQGDLQEPREPREPREPISAVAVSAGGTHVAWASGRSVHARAIGELEEDGGGGPLELFAGAEAVLDARPNALAFTPDGATIIAGGDDRRLHVLTASSCRTRRTLDGHEGAITAIAAAADGRTIASGGADRTIRIWDLGSGAEVGRLSGHTGAVNALSFSKDGALLASGSEDETIRLWRVDARREVARIANGAAVLAVALAGDGATVASAGQDGAIRMWASARGEEVARIEVHGEAVRSLVFTGGGGGALASGSDDGTVRLFDVTGRDTPGAELLARARHELGLRLAGARVVFERRPPR